MVLLLKKIKMINNLKEFLLDNWNKILPHIKRPRKLRFIIVKGSLGGYGGRVSFLFFPDNESKPAFIAKIARDPKYDQLISTEYNVLKYIHNSISSSLNDKVPQAFYLGQLKNHKFLIEESIIGKSVDAIISSRILNRKRIGYLILNVISDWLYEFKKEIAAKEVQFMDESNQQQLLSWPIEKFLKIYELTKKEKKFMDDLKNSISDIVKKKYPLALEHGDFSPINIIFTELNFKDSNFKVIDWEESKAKSLPLCDLFFLLTWYDFRNYFNKPEGKIRLNNFGQIFLKNGQHSAIATELIKKYCFNLGIDVSAVKILFPMFLINRANHEYDILSKQANRGYIPIIKPFNQGKNYKNNSLLRNNIYINLFSKFVQQSSEFIF